MNSMIIERDVAIPTDGSIVRADIFRPKGSQPTAAILALTPYGKGLEYKEGFPHQWEWMSKTHPNILAGSTQSFMVWETVDPEVWVSWNYAVIRIDARGTGTSPGFLDVFSEQETRDYYNAIEWTAEQPWCTGKVGLCGISYLAITQWLVAALQPPHLAAMIPWEGASDFYRDVTRHGGIASSNFLREWYDRQVRRVQHGNPSAPQDPWMKKSASGADETSLSQEELAKNHRDPIDSVLAHPLDDEFTKARSPDFSKITVPFLSCANWGGFGLHGRGNFEGYTQAASKQKWLEIHPGRHEEWFYLDEPMAMQKQFFDYFLKDEQNGWNKNESVMMRVHRPFESEKGELRQEADWPLPSTRWTEMFLGDSSLSRDTVSTQASVSFDALQNAAVFMSAPLEHETELTGPLSAKLFASGTTSDIDLFVTLQAFTPDGREVDFQGSMDPHTPLAMGWLRASQRKLDPKRSLPYRPYHSHDESLEVRPGEIYELDVELWPTHIILPAGYRVALHVGGKDFERPMEEDQNLAWMSKGAGPFLHTNPRDRPESIFGGRTTIHVGGNTPSSLLLPVIAK